MRVFSLALLFWITFLSPIRSFASDEMEERQRIHADVQAKFLGAKFEQLEFDASEYRQNRSRTASGLWKLTIFYVALAEALNVRGNEKVPDADFQTLDGIMKIWLKEFPKSPSANIAYGILLSNRGWAHRGGDYAHQVKPESWAPYRKYVAQARAHLEATKAVASGDPGWYGVMLGVARSQGWDRKDFDELLDEGLSKEPLYYQNYFAALEYLLPKWHGNLDDIEKFAQAAVKRTSKQEGQGMYARIYWFAAQTQFENEIFEESGVVWPRMREAFDDVVSRYPESWNLNNFAKFACLARDKRKAAELLRRTESVVVPQAWSPGLREACKAFALPGPDNPGTAYLLKLDEAAAGSSS